MKKCFPLLDVVFCNVKLCSLDKTIIIYINLYIHSTLQWICGFSSNFQIYLFFAFFFKEKRQRYTQRESFHLLTASLNACNSHG